MVTSCSRVMLSLGAVPSDTPEDTAQDWARAYQGVPPSTSLPLMRPSTVQTIARVMASLGAKVLAVEPVMMPWA